MGMSETKVQLDLKESYEFGFSQIIEITGFLKSGLAPSHSLLSPTHFSTYNYCYIPTASFHSNFSQFSLILTSRSITPLWRQEREDNDEKFLFH